MIKNTSVGSSLDSGVYVYACPVPEPWFPKLPDVFPPEKEKPYPKTEKDMKERAKEVLEALQKVKGSTDFVSFLNLFRSCNLDLTVHYGSSPWVEIDGFQSNCDKDYIPNKVRFIFDKDETFVRIEVTA